MRRRRFGRAALLAGTVLMLCTQAAWADNLVADSDGVTPVTNQDMSLGTVCAGTTTTKTVVLGISRNGAAGSPNVFKNSSTASVSVLSVTGAGLSASGGGSIAIPATWSTVTPTTITTATATATVVFTAGSAGPFSGTVTFRATGLNSANVSIERDDPMAVSATVSNCDTIPPTLNLPSPITAEATGPTGAVVTYTASATDANPANPTVTCLPASGATFPIATTTVNCSASDALGNTANGSFSVTVQDTTPPSIDGTPSAQGAEAVDASGAIVTYTDPTASDLVDGARPVSCLPASGSTFPLGTTAVSCTASDTRGNAATSGFNVVVSDTTDPILLLPGNITAEATSAAGAAVSFAVSAIDTVDGSVDVLCDATSGGTFPIGLTTVSCTATDDSGNDLSGSFTIDIVDTTAPDVTVPASFSPEATGASGAVATFAASALDVVDGAITPTCAPPSGSTFALGPTTVTCTATDVAGNTGSASFVITVVDTTPPDITVPADKLLEATGPGGAVASFSASATDLVDGSVAVDCSPASGSTFALGTTTVSCSASDAAGNAASGSFIVKVQDTTAPNLTLPSAITAEATGPGGAAVAYAASATDLVDGAIAPTCSPVSGATFGLGATTVNCSVSDNAGNSTSGSFQVTVQDTTSPSITVPSDITEEATGPSGAAVTFSVSAADLVDGALTPTCSATSGDTFPLGTTTVTCSATDNAGNPGSAAFDITVVDTTAPSITVPANIVTGPTSVSGAVVTYSGQSATDLVDGPVAVTCAPPSGSSFGFGATTVTCSASDAAGNGGSKTFTISVNGFTFNGFYQPVDMNAVNTVKNGSTVPVKWELFGAGGVEFTSTASVMTGWPKAQKLDCGSLSALPTDEIETTSTGNTSLRYDTTAGQFIYNWQTPKSAGTCWRLDVKLTDGSTKSATFKLK